MASRQLLDLAASAADLGGTEDANAAHNSEACQWASRARDLLAMSNNAMSKPQRQGSREWCEMQKLKGRIGGLKRSRERPDALFSADKGKLQKSAHAVQVTVLNRTRANRADELLHSNKPHATTGTGSGKWKQLLPTAVQRCCFDSPVATLSELGRQHGGASHTYIGALWLMVCNLLCKKQGAGIEETWQKYIVTNHSLFARSASTPLK